MSAEPRPQPGMSAEPRRQLDLGFERRGDRTVLDRRLFRWPFAVTRTFALDSGAPHLLSVVVQTSSGAMHRGDVLQQRFHVGPGAAAHCTTQGATAVQGADAGETARERVAITVEPGGYFEYMPDARILFPDAALDQSLEIECAAGGAFIAADAFTMHDPLAGARRGFDRLRSTLTLRSAGALLALDRAEISGADVALAGRYRAFGSLLWAQPGAAADMASAADEFNRLLADAPGLYAAASALPSQAGLAVRLAGHDLQQVRLAIARLWERLRLISFGATPSLRLFNPGPL